MDVFNSNGEVYENACDLPPAAETVAVPRAVDEESRDVRAVTITAVMRCDRGVEVITVITALFFAGSDQMSCNAGIKHGNGR